MNNMHCLKCGASMIDKPLFTSFYKECSLECDKITVSLMTEFESFIKNSKTHIDQIDAIANAINAWIDASHGNLPKDISPIILDNLDAMGVKL